MAQPISLTAVFDAPLERVWAELADLASHAEWMSLLALTFVSGWLLMVLPTWIACHYYPEHSLYASWWACSVNVMVVGIGLLLRFRAGHWMSMRVIEHTAAETTVEAPVTEPARVEVGTGVEG